MAFVCKLGLPKKEVISLSLASGHELHFSLLSGTGDQNE
jgi:hypothetical protein